MLQKKKISACIGMLFGSVFINAQAQIAPPPDYDQKLSNVIVNATRSGTPLDEIPLNTTILTKEVLEVAPDQTIDQILKNVPGVIISDQPYYYKDPTGQSINVRGLGNARTLVLIDGAPANDAFYGTVEWNKVPMSSIESVEFVRGGVSSLWGNYGMGGVINILTKTPKNSQQDVSASYGSFGTGNIAASKDIIASDDMQLRFSADYFSTEGYKSYATIYPGKPSNWATGMSDSKAMNSNVRLQGNFKVSQDTTGFFRTGYYTMEDLSTNYSVAKNLVQKADFATGTTTRLSDSEKVAVTVYGETSGFNKPNAGSASPNGKITAVSQDNYTTFAGSALYTKNLTGIVDQVMFGADARTIGASNDGKNYNSNQTTFNTVYAQATQNFYGLLGQIKSKSTSIPLEVTLAARLDQYTSQVPTNTVTLTSTGVTTATPVPNIQKTQLNPTLGILYNLNKDWDLRSAAYQAFHAPGMNNLLRSYSSSSGGSYFANPNLTPETMTGYEVGTDYRWRSGFFQLTGFNNFIRNAVASYTLANNSADNALAKTLCSNSSATYAGNVGVCQGSGVNYYTNNQNLQSQGIETQFHYDISSRWATDLNYAYTQTRLTWSGTADPANRQVGGVPLNLGSAGLTWYPVEKASLTATVRYAGLTWVKTNHSDPPVPPSAVVGLKANYQITPQASTYLAITNLFNRNYVTFGNSSASNYIAAPPQSITVGARIIF